MIISYFVKILNSDIPDGDIPYDLTEMAEVDDNATQSEIKESIERHLRKEMAPQEILVSIRFDYLNIPKI